MQIPIKGVIVSNDDQWIYDWLELDSVSPRNVAAAIADANGAPLDVEINSGGGDLMAGSEIYAALQGYPGEVRIHIVGMACSAASVIACAGWCDMARTGLLMIHNVSSAADGDHRDLEHQAGVLRTADRAVAAAYRAKTGKPVDELLEWMADETWMTAEDALAAGLIDAIANEDSAPVRLAASAGGLLPAETIRSFRSRRLAARLNLLRLKGEAR